MKLDTFIKRPVLSTVISIIIIVLGLIGLLTLPISQYPDIAPPTVEVKASYQGAMLRPLSTVSSRLSKKKSTAWKI